MDELKGLQELFDLGGNGALLALCYFAWKALGRFERIMDRFTRSLAAVREAVLMSNPDAAEIFARLDREENARELERLTP